MKSLYFSLILFFTLSVSSFAQNVVNPCGTVTTPEYWKKIASIDRNARLGMKSRSTIYVPVKIHVVGDDNGKGYFNTESIYILMCELNESFTPMDVKFYLYEDFNYINNSSYYIHDFSGGYDMMDQYNVPAVTNVYIVQDPAGNCGYAYYPGSGPSGGGIVLGKNCSGTGNSTFPHEMGHYLSLPHTFDQWDSNPEFVDSSNCAVAGDYFCDTPADFLDYRWYCPYTGSKADPKGDFYKPDGSFYMSYSVEPCGKKFSAEQQSAMLYSIVNDYNGDLVSHPTPSLTGIDSTVVLSLPADSAKNIAVSSVTLKWRKVPGATKYHLIFHRKGMSYIERIEKVVTDTFIVLNNLNYQMTYQWKVMAFHPNSFCSPFSKKREFTTMKNNVGMEESFDAFSDILVYPNPAKKESGLTIEIGQATNYKSVELISMHGVKIKSYSLDETNTTLDVKDIAAGFYLLRFTGNVKPVFKKIVIQ